MDVVSTLPSLPTLGFVVESRSDPPMPPHISTQVSKSTHSSVGGGGTTSGGGSGQQLLSPPKSQSDSSSVATIREQEEGRCGPVPMDTAPPCVVIDRQGRAGKPAVLSHSLALHGHSDPKSPPGYGGIDHAELLVGMPHVPQYQGMGEEEGQDSFKQQKQSETSSQERQPDTTQSGTCSACDHQHILCALIDMALCLNCYQPVELDDMLLFSIPSHSSCSMFSHATSKHWC